jgi:hypothetical protein
VLLNISKQQQIMVCPNGGCTDIKIMIGNLIITYSASNTSNVTSNDTDIKNNNTNNVDSHVENNTEIHESHSTVDSRKSIDISAKGIPLIFIVIIVLFASYLIYRKLRSKRK